MSEKTGDGIFIGIRLADKLEAVSGDTITIVSPANIEGVILQGSIPLTKKISYQRNFLLSKQ